MILIPIVVLTAFSAVRAAGADELDNWWRTVRESRSTYVASIPENVRKDLEQVAKDFFPIRIIYIEENGKTEQTAKLKVVQGDFNCDGKPDFAVDGIPKTDPLARALTDSNKRRSSEDLASLKTHYDNLRPDLHADIVWLGLGNGGGGYHWKTYPGSAQNMGRLDMKKLKYMAEQVSEADLKWAKVHHCDVLSIACCEGQGPGGWYLWSHQEKKLIKHNLGD